MTYYVFVGPQYLREDPGLGCAGGKTWGEGWGWTLERSGFLRCSGWGGLVTGDRKEESQLLATMVAIPLEGLAT